MRGRFTCADSEQDESSEEVQETDGIRCVCLFVGLLQYLCDNQHSPCMTRPCSSIWSVTGLYSFL